MDQYCEGVITLNEQGEAGFYCADYEHYFVCCLACSGLAYDDWNDEVYVVDQMRPDNTWCRFVGLHVCDYDVQTYNLALYTPPPEINNGVMNHYVNERVYSVPGDYLRILSTAKLSPSTQEDENNNFFPFITGTDGGNPLWWKCDCCETVYSMTDK